MWKYGLSFAIVLALGIFLFPRNEKEPHFESYSPVAEMQAKQALLKQDLQITAELCRSQCSFQLEAMAQAPDLEPADAKLQAMKQLQAEHPHMEQLLWTSRSQPIGEALSSGSLSEHVRTLADPYIAQAQKQIEQGGGAYQSPSFESEGSTFFAVGVPGKDSSALLGVVRQNILPQVESHQLNNLRIVNYPANNHYKIESVDAQTLQDIDVKHPEHNQGTSHYHINQVVVRFNKLPSEADLQRMQADIGAAKPYRKLGYTYIFESSHMEAKQLMNYFHNWDIQYVEPHFLYLTNTAVPTASETGRTANDVIAAPVAPNDSLYQRYQWNLPLVDTELGWTITKGSKDVIVAVVDTGVDLDHPDLVNQLVGGYNVVDVELPPMDDVGHGTHVAGVIGAIINNRIGVAGMSWYNPIMPIKVLDHTGAGSTYAVAQGIIWATDHGAKVINLSLGNYADANFLHDAIQYAYDHDVVLIAASGNDNTEQAGYPAAYPEVFAVAAADAQRKKATFSNYGDYIDVAAPGVSIASTYPHNQYASLSGTSMASPHVTALAALIRSANPKLSNHEVMQIMRDTATDAGPVGKDKYFGYGIIDVAAALRSAAGIKNKEAASAESGGSTTIGTDNGNNVWGTWLQRLLGQLQTE
ncbi:S8 family peptidase [Paenibacillus agricola]|uniref:Peptidase S8 n=1 Tax=Paenibacillus agricola TaxID=2716264 RepID=A0ABX0J5J6_9BACL|nr:S8 family peptidase [Paenibacillus agricola]NHN30918.1 peptidase S8 [Paenibacillus agricola]